jgi:hypothetical protein
MMPDAQRLTPGAWCLQMDSQVQGRPLMKSNINSLAMAVAGYLTSDEPPGCRAHALNLLEEMACTYVVSRGRGGGPELP